MTEGDGTGVGAGLNDCESGIFKGCGVWVFGVSQMPLRISNIQREAGKRG